MSFAIVIPVGAWSAFLPAALRSLALQSVDLEVALCDASQDVRVAAAADASGIAFAHRRHAPDQGQADAIAEGWARTRGEILGWLNVDDVLLPGALEDAAAAFAQDPALDVWFGHTAYFNDAGATIGAHDSVAPASPLLLRSCTISQPSCFARRSAVDAVGGIDRFKHYTMDWDLWSRLYRNGARFADTSAFYSSVLIQAGSKTSSLSPARLAEVYAVARAGAGPYAAVKSVIGVTIHHLENYSGVGPLVRRLTRSGVAPGAKGASAAGSVGAAAALPVLNLSDADQHQLTVRLGGPGSAQAQIEIDGQRVLGPSAEFILPAAVAPGHAASLELTPCGDDPVWLERAQWAGA